MVECNEKWEENCIPMLFSKILNLELVGISGSFQQISRSKIEEISSEMRTGRICYLKMIVVLDLIACW